MPMKFAGSYIPYSGFFSGGKIFVVFVVEQQTTKYLPTKVNYSCNVPRPLIRTRGCTHVVDQRVLDSVWPYFDTSRGKRTTYPILMAL